MFHRTDEEKELFLTAYKGILSLIPKLKRLLPIQKGTNPNYFYNVMRVVCSVHTVRNLLMDIMQMQGACNMAHSKAIRCIKQNIVRYLEAGQVPIKLDTQARDKSLHSLNNPITGQLLIPAEYVLN